MKQTTQNKRSSHIQRVATVCGAECERALSSILRSQLETSLIGNRIIFFLTFFLFNLLYPSRTKGKCKGMSRGKAVRR